MELTPEQIAQLALLAEAGVLNAIKLYQSLAASHSSVKPLADILAEANATADQVIATADAEIAKAQATTTE